MTSTNGLSVLLIVLAGVLGYAWVVHPAEGRDAHLSRIYAEEGAMLSPVPPTWAAQVAWVVRHRRQRLAHWQGVLAAAALAGLTEGVLWRRRQVFRGYHLMLWRWGWTVLGVLVLGSGLFLGWPRAIPTVWACPGLAGLTVAASFALVAGARVPVLR